MLAFRDLIRTYADTSHSTRNQGDKFEWLMREFLLTYPVYSYTEVYLWKDFPFKDDLGSIDTGIDIVAVNEQGEFTAVQCKCYAENHSIQKSDVDTFLTTSARAFGSGKRFSYRLFISTSNNWSSNAEEALQGQSIPVNRLSLTDLENARVDWEKLEQGIHGKQARLAGFIPKPHQIEATKNAKEYFSHSCRGQLIMACGTGKTFTSLKIAEEIAGETANILFCVPSIALLGQTLKSWAEQKSTEMNFICVCSDTAVSRKTSKNSEGNESIIELALPASTDPEKIEKQLKKGVLNVIFSTYQSIGVIEKLCKKELLFDLIICDEAHRTTGVIVDKKDESYFTKVHDNELIKGKKRLYMTATPRLYNSESKAKADRKDYILCSMDDENVYGSKFYELPFGKAVELGLLSDYKVIIMNVSEKSVPEALQQSLTKNGEIEIAETAKIIGCINALSKQIVGDNNYIVENDSSKMFTAVLFEGNIKASEMMRDTLNVVSSQYSSALPRERAKEIVEISAKHIDGSMNAPMREGLINWLKNTENQGNCKILCNVRCLSEGVDVPSLDAIIFAAKRNSYIEVVQSVGRVMRKSEGKKYGYIIIPIFAPSNLDPEDALDDNERYRVVWSVLNALRSHDERIEDIVNKLDLNKKQNSHIFAGTTFDENENSTQLTLPLEFKELQQAIYGRIVTKVGDRAYWENWAKSVGKIAERLTDKIAKLADENPVPFDEFLTGIKKSINESLTLSDVIEMLSQHIITRPVFNALFENYKFADKNAVSVAMQKLLENVDIYESEQDKKELESFYNSVAKRAKDLDNGEGRQRVIIELYNNFFTVAFPKMAERLGIVYTPVPVVDFIIHSVDEVLKREFGKKGITDKKVTLLDPFTGTGTFIVRLLQSGLIDQKDLKRKYSAEIFANEIVLLAYYIAAVNIENAYHDLCDSDEGYTPFEGICLTDTFNLDPKNNFELDPNFMVNQSRIKRQKDTPVTVIFGNPPYSAGQRSANDNAANQKYPDIDNKISATYAKSSTATNKNSLYDSYIRAFRWSTDRIGENAGVIAFVTNGGWLDGNSADGFRKAIEEEFDKIYVFNLRGNARTSGEQRRKEAGNIFESGSRASVTITLLIKNPKS